MITKINFNADKEFLDKTEDKAKLVFDIAFPNLCSEIHRKSDTELDIDYRYDYTDEGGLIFIPHVILFTDQDKEYGKKTTYISASFGFKDNTILRNGRTLEEYASYKTKHKMHTQLIGNKNYIDSNVVVSDGFELLGFDSGCGIYIGSNTDISFEFMISMINHVV